MDTPIATILDRKGRDVTTITAARTLADAARLLESAGIGAVVVSSDGRAIEGMLSERDIVRRLAHAGPGAMRHLVEDAMTVVVATCTPRTTVGEVMALMTDRRVRHVPVVDDAVLVGIVSIGDVVKQRIDALEQTSEQLRSYVVGSY